MLKINMANNFDAMHSCVSPYDNKTISVTYGIIRKWLGYSKKSTFYFIQRNDPTLPQII